MRDRLQPSTAPADFRVANLQAVRGSNSKADSFRFTVAMAEERSVWMDDLRCAPLDFTAQLLAAKEMRSPIS